MKLYGRLLRYLRPYVWPRFTIAVIAMVLFGSTNGVMPFLVRGVFDDVFSTNGSGLCKCCPW